MSRELLLLLIMIALITLVSGCLSPSEDPATPADTPTTSPTATPANIDPEQAAYDDLMDKYDRLEVKLNDFKEVLNTSPVDTAMSNPGSAGPVLNSSIRTIDDYIEAANEFTAASGEYLQYLEPDGPDYQWLMNVTKQANDSVEDSETLRGQYVDMREWLGAYVAWENSANATMKKMNETPSADTEEAFQAWAISTASVISEYYNETDRFSAATDKLIARPWTGPDMDEKLEKIKALMHSGNAEFKADYNRLVDQYNEKYGASKGAIPRI